MIACYILDTPGFDKFYIGATQDDVIARLKKHNHKAYGNTSTSFTSDWELFLVITCTKYSQAINIERHVKKMKSKTYIRTLRQFPEMAENLLLQYS